MKLSRVIAAITAALAFSSPAVAQTPVRLALGTSTINVGYPNNTLPLTLGYWKEEGLDVTLLAAGSTLQGVQQLVGNNVDYFEGNVAGILQAVSKNKLPLRVVSTYGVTDWRFVVQPNSPISQVKDLAGKRVGMISLASGAVPLLKAYLLKNGLDPNSVDIIPVGTGAAPMEALRGNKIDALLYWASAIAGFENAGLKMKTFAPSEWIQMPDYVLASTQATLRANPAVAIGMARGMAKAILFADTNPECALKLHWKYYPATRSQAADEKTSAEWDMKILKKKLETYTDAARLSNTWGKIDDKYWKEYQAFLVETKQVNAPLVPSEYLVDIPDFFKKVNDFDHQAIVKQAQACAF